MKKKKNKKAKMQKKNKNEQLNKRLEKFFLQNKMIEKIKVKI